MKHSSPLTPRSPDEPLPVSTSPAQPAHSLIVLGWVVLLLTSLLPNILWQELTGESSRWMFYGKVILLGVLFVSSFAVQTIRPLRNFFAVLLAMYASEEIFSWVGNSTLWQNWFGGQNAPFVPSMMGTQLLRMGTSLVMIAVLILLGYRRAQFFLVRGKIDAPIAPVRWLGFSKAEPWTRFGGQFAVYISLGLLVFLVMAARPSPSIVIQALPFLPAVLLFAGMNAFSEEMTYRASMLAPLEKVVGAQHALWLTAAFFGIGHYYGVPYGVIGVIMAGFLGWLLGKSMLETRGFFWAWFIHFLQDVLIFSFMALGSITPGGG